MQLTLFQHAQDIWPRLVEAEIPALFSEARPRPAQKDSLACWSPVAYKPGTRRGKANVESVHALVLDYDSIAPLALAEVLRALEPYEYHWHTTYSHRSRPWCLRIALPLAAPIPAQYWTATFKRAASALPVTPDPVCSDASRLFYLPCVNADGTPADHGTHDGRRLVLAPSPDTGAGVTSPAPVSGPTLAPGLVGLAEVEAIAKRLCRSQNVEKRNDGLLIKAVCEGRPYALPGARHSTMLRVTHLLARELPGASPASLARLFAASQAAMGPDADPVSAVEVALQGARQKLDESRDARRQAAENEQRARIQLARGDGADHPYTDAELAEIARKQGCQVEDLKQRWLVFKDSHVWALTRRGYVGPFSGKDTLPAIAHALSPASVRIRELVGDGPSAKFQLRNLNEILHEYGSEIRTVFADITIQESVYDASTQHFHEATAPRARLVPTFHHDVHLYLLLLGGHEREQLLDWIAGLVHLDRQCCAVYICGPQGVGKTMLVTGLAKEFLHGHFTPASAVFTRFNDTICKAPLAFADEALPNDRTGSAAIRELLGNTSLTIEPKGRPHMTLRGCPRLILAGNNPWMIRLQESNGRSDLEALARRILYVSPFPESASYLESLSQEVKDSWVSHKIAEHALYLSATRRIKSGARFLVEGHLGASLRRLLVSGDKTALMCEWLTNYLLRPQAAEHAAPRGIKRHGGRLYVTTKAVRECWEMYHHATIGRPTTKEINTSLTALARGQEGEFFDIDMDTVAVWSETHGQGTATQLQGALW